MQYAKSKNFRKPLGGFWNARAIESIRDGEIKKLALSFRTKFGSLS
jgi:hypothetical protein